MAEWNAKPDPDGDGSWIVETQARGERDGLTVWIGYGLTEPNAHMISATQEMYDALVKAEAIMPIVAPRSNMASYLECLGEIRKAINKAEGHPSR